MCSRIEIIVGSMFSGKSTELIRRCHRYECIEKHVLIINSVLDTRCSINEVQTHNNQTHKALKVTRLMDIVDTHIVDTHVIGIDEAQFFDDLFEFLIKIEHLNKIVIVAGLDGDFKRNTFGKILKCIPLADNITKLTAMCSICKDGTPAIFSKKINDDDDNIIDVGATEKYIAVCRKHY